MKRDNNMIKSYGVLYLAMEILMTYGVLNSPFIAEHYLSITIFGSIALFLSSFYLLGWSTVKKAFNSWIREARTRAQIRHEVEKKVKQELESYELQRGVKR